MRKQIAIYGGGGFGMEMLSLLKALPDWEVIGFYDDDKPAGASIKSYPVLGTLQNLKDRTKPQQVILSMGDPKSKWLVAKGLSGNSLIEFPVIIHPRAIIQDDESVVLGKGCILTAGVILTTDIQLGEHVLLNLNCTIGHGVRIGSCSSLMPGVHVAGGVTIGNHVLIGSGSSILGGITIGDGARIGSGAVVTKNVPAGETVVGVPARSLKE